MNRLKVIKDAFAKWLLGTATVPSGLNELNRYFRLYGPIHFNYEKQADGAVVAVSENFVYGSIVTSGKDEAELEKNIADAILTSFEVPSSYAKEAAIHKVGARAAEYAPA
jgi:hypothetical protein